VAGAPSVEEARKVAKTIVGSPLVKTAMYGNDANWGRIIAAIGYSEVDIVPEKVTIAFGDETVLEHGEPVAYSEENALCQLDRSEVIINVELGIGEAEGTAWGCDLTYDYVKINGSYRS